MMKEIHQRILEQLAFRYWCKNKNRSSEENWKLAKKLLSYIDKRKSLIIKLMEKNNVK